MEWSDDGIVLGIRRHGEGNAILEVMTRDRGRHLGMVRGGGSRRQRPLLQPGNNVRVVWRARLDEHLGHFQVETLRQHEASQFAASHVVYGVTHLAALCRLLPERDPHPEIYDSLAILLDRIGELPHAAVEIVRFELLLLTEMGFGLDLESCAATGVSSELDYVSPKSGRAVSRQAGAPWQDRLFRLPAFLQDASSPSLEEIAEGFALTGYFLASRVLEPRGLTFAEARAGFMAAVLGRKATENTP
jgi:DNA repair protein RecO (recombination protein O)